MFSKSGVDRVSRMGSRLQRRPGKSARGVKGNTLVLVSAITIGLLIAIVLFALNYGRLLGGSTEHLTAIEAASLAAAQDLSRVVINDDYYGYISLSDYPPIGLGTKAADKEPLPVLSINTVLATARLDMIIAQNVKDQTGDSTVFTLAKADVAKARAAANSLNATLASVLNGGTAKDLDGNTVDPLAHAQKVYQSNLTKLTGGDVVVNSFKLSLGYLENGSTTLTDLPKPDNQAQVSPDQQLDGHYKAFVSVPACGEDFYFAGIARQPSLVDARQFRDPDSKRACSIVKAEADHTITASLSQGDNGEQVSHPVHSIACAQPSGNTDMSPPGVLTLGFPNGLVPGINSIKDIFSNGDLNTNTSKVFTAQGGDWPSTFPGDPSTSLLAPGNIPGISNPPSVTQTFGTGFFHWLRAARTRPKISAIDSMLTQNFSAIPDDGSQVYCAQVFPFCPPAFAKKPDNQGNTAGGNDFAVMAPTSQADRDAAWLAGGADAKSSYWSVAANLDVSHVAPPNSPALELADDGSLRSGGKDITLADVQAFQNALSASNTAALATLAAANKAASVATTLTETTNATNAITNAALVASRSHDMVNNEQWLTGKGIQVLPDGRFKVNGDIVTSHPMPSDVASILGGTANSGDINNTSWTADPASFDFYKGKTAPNDKDKQDEQITAEAGKYLFLYEFDATGQVVSTNLCTLPFQYVPVSHNQIYTVSYDAIKTQSGKAPLPLTWAATMRDETATIGLNHGGIHAGQPMLGDPADWCRVDTFFNTVNGKGSKKSFKKDDNKARSKAKGDYLGIDSPVKGWSGHGNGWAYGKWKSKKGGALTQQPRAAFFCGGLSCDFQIRSPMAILPAPSGAAVVPPGGLVGGPSLGPAFANIGGVNLRIPNTFNYTIGPGAKSSDDTGAAQSPGPDTQTSTKVQAPVPNSLI